MSGSVGLPPAIVEKYHNRLKEIADLLVQLQGEDDVLDILLVKTLIEELHKVCGLAGYFGHNDLGRLSRELEDELKILSLNGMIITHMVHEKSRSLSQEIQKSLPSS